jgi:prephenate dehydrogenase
MDPAAHDEALALTSHLPHVVAAALAASIPPNLLHLAGGAYRDGTRVAGSDGALWAGIFLANRNSVLDALDRFRFALELLRRAIAEGNEVHIEKLWPAGPEFRNYHKTFGHTPIKDQPLDPPFDQPPSSK